MLSKKYRDKRNEKKKEKGRKAQDKIDHKQDDQIPTPINVAMDRVIDITAKTSLLSK